MAESKIKKSSPEFFGYKTRDSRASSGNVFGVYFPDTGMVQISFYYTSTSNVGTDTLFTIDSKYAPSNDQQGACMVKQASVNGNVLLGNCLVTPSGNISNYATATCYSIFGILTYKV